MLDHTSKSQLRDGVDADGCPWLAFPEPFNIAEIAIDRHLAEGRGCRLAIRTFEQDVTYAQLIANVNRFGRALTTIGLGQGDRLLMVVNDCPEFVYLFWGAIKAGIVPVPLNTLLRADDFTYIITDSQCAGLVYSPEFAREVEAALAQSSRHPAAVLRLDDARLQQAAREASAELHAVPAHAEADCFWLYTSGTTGRPKGVVHCHRAIAVTCRRFAVETLGATEADVFFSVPRLYFSYGLGCAMTNPLWVGGTMVLDHRRPTPETVSEIFRRFGPTVFAGVPTFYAAVLAAGTLTKTDVAQLRRSLSGGEATPPELQRRWHELTGVPIIEVIGSTECLHIFMGNRIDDIRSGSLGKPVPGYRVKLLDEAGDAVADGTPGRMWVRGQSLMRCYWNDPERTARAWRDGWLDTGDMVKRDREGYYYYCGRADDMLKVAGRLVSPFEIEATIVEDPRVLEVAIVGRPDDDGLAQIEAWVVLKDPALACERTADEIRSLCKRKLAPYKYPKRVCFLDRLPKTATGKVQRFKLRTGP